jgi:hypothetical protein
VDPLRQEEPDRLAGRYEGIRADVTGRASVGQRQFCERGLAAWLSECCCSPGRPARRRASVSIGGAPGGLIPTGNADALTMAIASLVHTVVTGAAPC